MAERLRVLYVDDDYNRSWYASALRSKGYDVDEAVSVDEAKQKLTSERFDLAVLDISLPPGQEGPKQGQVLGLWIKQHYPGVKLIGISALESAFPFEVRWFKEHGSGFAEKRTPEDLAQYVARVLDGTTFGNLKSFIVHGHDDTTKLELKNFLQNRLHLTEPVILHEMPSMGMTVIEKFEDYAHDVDLVFVLLTPDDKVAGKRESNAMKRRARQNVIFEMGFFLGRLGRKKGAVILLHKGDLELPSDISGLVDIDISDGIEAAADLIRREVEAFCKQHAR